MRLHLLLTLLTLLLPLSHAHQSISFPYPMSHDVACRISSQQNCPGPCPRHDLRLDMNKNNPTVTVRRDSWLQLKTLKNNHRGGFSRWSIVNIRDMYNKKKHAANAFLWSCADTGIAKCGKRNKPRDCPFDVTDQYYTHLIQIPKIYSDGIYVLGWVWFGGGERWGAFGDYYDCMYIRVQGGPIASAHRPTIKPGNSVSRVGDKCRATVNRVGVCWSEPCPNGGYWTSLLKPWEFSDGRQPKTIPRMRFKYPYNPKKHRYGSPYIHSMTVRSADYPSKIYTSSLRTKFPYLYLTKRMRSTVTCETRGNVRTVVFYVNGRKGREDNEAPYSIAGDWKDYETKRTIYAPWGYDVDRRVSTVSCVAYGYDGTEHWRTIELSTTV